MLVNLFFGPAASCADALVRSVHKTIKKLTIDESERPVTIQIYGRSV